MTATPTCPVGLGVHLAVGLALLSAPAMLDAAPGATPADFTVDASGNASAHIELTVPPGPHGVQPKLALAYSSADRNGLVGVGWSLQGVSAITRIGPSSYYDGDELMAYWNRVSYIPRADGSINDRFALDGQRLIVVKNSSGGALTTVQAQNAAYGRAGTEYHTAIESWTKVTAQGTAGQGPQYFVAYLKDGTMLEFGKTDDSRLQIPSGATVRIWALNQVKDPNGNTMTFSYTKDVANGECRLASISYTANPTSSPALSARNRIDFTYEDRSDKTTTYQAGSMTKLTRRLKEIQTYVGSTRVRTYKLAYGYGQATRRSRMTSLEECDGSGGCMPATTFSYSDFAPNGTFNIVTPTQSKPMLADFIIPHTGDYNGDGKTDFIRQEKGTWASSDNVDTFSVYFAKGNGDFNIVTPVGDKYQVDLKYDAGANILPGDFNGDGLTDFLRQERGDYSKDSNNTFNVYFSKGDGYFDIVTPSGNMYQYDLKADEGCNIIPADVNGDGVTDFFRQEKNNWIKSNADNTFNVYFSQRNGYFNRVTPTGSQTKEYQEWLKYNPGAIIIPGDYNGDGAADFLRQEWNDWDNDTTNTFQVYSSQRNGYFVISQSDSPDYQNLLRYDPGANIIPGDFNGDGLQDFIRQTWNGWDNGTTGNFQIYFSRGAGLFDIVEPAGAQYQEWLRYDPGAYIIPGDFNGDGVMDFIRQEKGSIANDNNSTFNVYLSRGDGYFDIYTPPGDEYQARLKGTDTGVVITVGDYNGDGIDDFMAMRKKSAEGSTYYWVYLSKGPVPDLLTAMADGLKKTTAIAYKPLTDPTVYTRGAAVPYPEVNLQPTTSVVASFTLSDANGNTVTQSYTYEGMRTRRNGPGMTTFAKVHKLDTSSNVKQTTEYYQDDFLGGQVKSIVKAQGTATLESSTFAYHTAPPSSRHPYLNVSQPLLWRTEVGHWVSGVWKYSTRQDYIYDGYANITKVVDWGDVNVTSEQLYTSSQYRNSENPWMLGLVTEIKQSKADGSSLSSWDAARDLTWEKRSYDAKGNVTRQERYDDQNSAWLASVITRNGLGDPISTVDPTGNTATLVYDDSYTYVKERRIVNGSQPALITRFEYDTRFGEMTSQTDPSGRTLTYTLDGFGRFTVVQGPRADDPNQRVELIRREWANTSQGMLNTIWSRTDWAANYGSTASPWYWEKQSTDGFGRVYKKETLGPDGKVIVEDTSYTPQGWVARRTFPHWSTETGSTLPGVTITYDARGLPTTMTSGGIVTSIAMNQDGKSFTRTEAVGTSSARATSYTFNSRLQVVSKRDAEAQVTQFQYDPISRPTRVIDPGNVTHTAAYTSLGLKKEVSDPDTGTTRFSYSRGLLSSETDADGNTIRYTYDETGRVRQRSVTWTRAGASQSTVVDYQYDTANGAAAYTNLAGNLYRVTTTTQGVLQSEVRYGYDAYGHETLMEVRLDGQPTAFVFRYSYDPLGRQVEQVFPDNARVRTSYQPGGNMIAVALEDAVSGTRQASRSYVTYRNYTPRSEPTAVEYGNGVQVALTFDPILGMLTKNTMTVGAPSSASSPVLVNDQYAWNALGDITEIKDLRTASAGAPYDPYTFHNMTRTFTYSSAGRLADANARGTYGYLSFRYNAAGDITSKDAVTYTIGAGHRVTGGQKAGATVFTAGYDARGNRVTSTGEAGTQWSYAYDGANQLLEVKKNNAVVGTFQYDFSGRRTRKTDVATGATTWYVAQDYEVTVGAAGGQTLHTKYLTGEIGPAVQITHPGSEVSLVGVAGGSTPVGGTASHPAVGTYYLHKDHVGSTQVVTDASGRIVSRTVYKPFGDIDVASSEGSDVYRAKFGGQEFDAQSGLYYFNARYYDARIGRFLTADSVMGSGFLQVDAFNRYAFAGNNPIRNIDPTGHSFIVGLIVGAIVGATVAIAKEVITQGVQNGFGNIKVGKVLAAGLRGAISGMVSAAVGGGVSKVADKAVKRLTEGVKQGVKRAISIGVEALAGAAGDAAVQAASNGIQVARGEEVDWARSMLVTISVGAIAGGAGEALDGWQQSKRGSYDVTRRDAKGGPQRSSLDGLSLLSRDQLRELDNTSWGIQLGVGAGAELVSSGVNKFFDDPENNSETTGNAFSTSGVSNAPQPEYNGSMIINVMSGQASLNSALDRLEASGPSN